MQFYVRFMFQADLTNAALILQPHLGYQTSCSPFDMRSFGTYLVTTALEWTYSSGEMDVTALTWDAA